MNLTLKFLVLTIFTVGLVLAGEHPVAAQTSTVNPEIRVSETGQPESVPVPEIRVTKKRIIAEVIINAGISVCDQFEKCRRGLDVLRGILGGGEPAEPQVYNRQFNAPVTRRGSGLFRFR